MDYYVVFNDRLYIHFDWTTTGWWWRSIVS